MDYLRYLDKPFELTGLFSQRNDGTAEYITLTKKKEMRLLFLSEWSDQIVATVIIYKELDNEVSF